MLTKLKQKIGQEPETYAVFLRGRKHKRVVVVRDDYTSQQAAMNHATKLISKGLPAYCCEVSTLVEHGILNRIA